MWSHSFLGDILTLVKKRPVIQLTQQNITSIKFLFQIFWAISTLIALKMYRPNQYGGYLLSNFYCFQRLNKTGQMLSIYSIEKMEINCPGLTITKVFKLLNSVLNSYPQRKSGWVWGQNWLEAEYWLSWWRRDQVCIELQATC